jgi:hypothetical protein
MIGNRRRVEQALKEQRQRVNAECLMLNTEGRMPQLHDLGHLAFDIRH